EGGHIRLIVAVQQDGQTAAPTNLRLQIGNQCAPDPASLGGGSDHQWMQLPNPRIGQTPANPAQHAAVCVTGDTTELAWLKRLVYLTPGRCKVGPGIGRMRTKPDMERLGSLLNGDVIIRVKIGDLHATLLVSVVRLPRRNRMRGYCACSILARHDGRHAA